MRRKTEILLCRWLCPHHFILLMGVSAFLAFGCGYAISVGGGQVSAVFPYISDTGTTFPASGVFALLLNIAACFAVIAMYIRHGYNETTLVTHRDQVVNDISAFCGMLICLGLMMVACFPWTLVLIPHLIGALLVFVVGCVYCWMQCYISYISMESWRNVKFYIRITLSIVSSLSFLLTFIFASVALNEGRGKVKNTLKWNAEEPGYVAHLWSAFSEWIMAISFLLYFFTYYWEFKTLESAVNINTKLYEELEGLEVAQT